MGIPSRLSSEKFWSSPLILQKQMEGFPSQFSSVVFMFLYEEGVINVPVQTEELDRGLVWPACPGQQHGLAP